MEKIAKQAVNKQQIPADNSYNTPVMTENDTERILKYGTYEYDLANNSVTWSDGVYEVLGIDKNKQPLGYDDFLSCLLGETYHNLPEDVKQDHRQKTTYEEDYRIGSQPAKTIRIYGLRVCNNEILVSDTGLIRDISREKEDETAANKTINELMRSNQDLEQFAYIASHDLQEPVRKITTFGQRLSAKLEGKLDTEEQIYLDRMLVSADNMRLLIDNLLAYSRVSRNNEPFELVNLNFIFQQVKSELELLIEETGANITCATLPHIHASASQMKQLFANIVGNAIKFRNKEVAPDIKITASLIGEDEKKKYGMMQTGNVYKIQVGDNGIGFEQEYAERIFQVFQRLHGKSEYPGSGIGLAICKKIAEHHHGVIFAEGKPGIGAYITILLPE